MADRVKGITIQIGGDTVKLQDSLKKVNADLRETQSSLRDTNRLLKFDPGNLDLLEQKQKFLSTAIDDTKEKLKQEQEALESLKNAPNASETTKQQEALTREIEATQQELQKLEKQYKNFGSVAGQQIQAAGKSIDEFGKKLSAAGVTLTKDLSAPLAALGGLALKSFADVDEGADIIATKTGASGEALKDMEAIMNRLATTVPEDFDVIGSAIGEVNTRFGITGEGLESLSEQFVKFAKLNNTDVSTSVDSAQKALSAFGLGTEDATALLDILNLTSQKTGADVTKMSEGLIQNAAAFQEMGLSIEESTIFMGQLETSGANSETVMQGLRKALKNAAKDGKPLNQALAELQNQILNGTDGMDGLTAAYDIFGKSGDQIYNAVKNGSIDFRELAEASNDAAGSVSETFENTLDPIDQWKMTLNELKIAGAKLGSSLGTVLKPILEKVGSIVRKAADAFDSLDDGTKETIVKFGLLAAAAGPVVSIFGKVTSGVGTLVTGFGKLVGVVTPAATSIGGMGTALGGMAIAAAPAVAAFTGLAAAAGTLYWGLTKTDYLTREQIESLGGLNETEEKLIATIGEHADAYEELKTSSDAAFATMTDSYSVEEKDAKALVRQLKNISDEEGNIKAGYEERAKTITGTLADAYGVEVEIIDGQIQQYGELNTMVEAVMATKRAEAALSAYQDEYTQAVKSQEQAFRELTAAQAVQAETQAAYNDIMKYAEGATINANGAYEYQGRIYGSMNELLYSESGGLIQNTLDYSKAQQELKADVDAANMAVSDASNTYYSGQSTIANYGKVTSAVANGDVKAMQDAVDALSEHFLTSEIGNKESLQRQVDDIKSEYDTMLEEWRTGNTDLTAADLAAKYDRYNKALAELEKYKQMNVKEGGDAGRGNIDAYTAEVEAGSKRAEVAANKVARTATAKMEQQGTQGATAAATMTTNKYAGGLTAGATSVNAAASNLATNATAKMNASSAAYNNGVNAAQGFANGISAGAYAVYNAAVSLAAQADFGIRNRLDEHSPSRLLDKLGVFGTKGFVNGLIRDKDEVYKAGTTIAGEAVDGISTMQAPIGGITSAKGAGIVAGAVTNNNSTTNASVNINVYGSQGQDVNALADAVAKTINDAVFRKKAVYA